MLVLAAAAITVILSMGLRSSFGLFLRPVSADLGWGREIFAFGMALQNLLWGVFQPVAGAIADRFGAGRVIAGGGVLYALGLYVMSTTSSPQDFHLSAGLLIGMAQSGAGLSVVLGAAGRVFPEERRSWALGVITAAASLGVAMPVEDMVTMISMSAGDRPASSRAAPAAFCNSALAWCR